MKQEVKVTNVDFVSIQEQIETKAKIFIERYLINPTQLIIGSDIMIVLLKQMEQQSFEKEIDYNQNFSYELPHGKLNLVVTENPELKDYIEVSGGNEKLITTFQRSFSNKALEEKDLKIKTNYTKIARMHVDSETETDYYDFEKVEQETISLKKLLKLKYKTNMFESERQNDMKKFNEEPSKESYNEKR